MRNVSGLFSGLVLEVIKMGERRGIASHTKSFDFISFPTNDFSMNMYAIVCNATEKVALIDSGAADENEFNVFKEWATKGNRKVTHLLQTHAHVDHILGLTNSLGAFPEATIYMHSYEQPLFDFGDETAKRYGIRGTGVPLPKYQKLLDDKKIVLLDGVNEIGLGDLVLKVLFTPGHTPGHCCFIVKEPEKDFEVMFSGDFLFKGSIGRTDLPLSDPHVMKHSLERAFSPNCATTFGLRDRTLVLSGHGDPTTLADERKRNPFIQALL